MRHFETHINNTKTYINVKTLFINKTYKLYIFEKEKKTRDVRQSCTRSSITTKKIYDNIARMSMQNKKLENQILPIFLYFYTAVSRKHIVGFSKLYGGDFNRFTTLVMVDLSVGSTLVSSFKANSNHTFVLFGSGVFWNKFEVESW